MKSKPFIIYLSTMLFVLVMSLILVVMGQGGIASLTLLLGMTSTIFGALFYVVFIDSKKEWPELRWYDRLLKVMTFQR